MRNYRIMIGFFIIFLAQVSFATKLSPQAEPSLLDFEKYGDLSCTNSTRTVMISKIKTNITQDLLLLKKSPFDLDEEEIDLLLVKITKLDLKILETRVLQPTTATVTTLYAKLQIEGDPLKTAIVENFICEKVEQEEP